MDRLNFFNPYKDKEIMHEDVLTRNFLILVKNIPSVQVALLELIKEKMQEIEIESAAAGKLVLSEIYTQISSGNMLVGLQDQKILSIIISDDEFQNSHLVRGSERKARYDGIMICDPSWVFIIENKPYVGNIWEGQLDPNVDDANGNELIEQPCCLSWRDIIGILNAVLEHNTSCQIEKTLINEFLEYINDNYSWLNPYSKFGLCNGKKELLDKRCSEILQKCFPEKELKYHKGWKYYIDISSEDPVVQQIALDYEDGGILLLMYGGDTMVSSRRLYENIKTDNICNKSDDYLIEPNFHISFQRTGLVWLSTTSKSLLEYIEYWKNNDINQVKREDFFEYYSMLVENRIIDANDEEISMKILSKNYQKLNIIPGLFFGFKWSLDEAIKLDNEGRFIDECKEKIKIIESFYSD